MSHDPNMYSDTYPHLASTDFKPEVLSGGETRFVVKRLVGSIRENHVLRWINTTGHTITIMFPPNADPLAIGFTTLKPGEELTRSVSRAIPFYSSQKNRFRYAIFCHETNNFMVMNSDPEIIIVE